MSWKSLGVIVVGMSMAMSAADAAAQSYSRQQLQEVYMKYLAAEGYRPEVSELGNVRFRREGRPYAILVDEKDPTLFRVVLTFAVDNRSPALRERRLEALNTAALETRLIKTYINDKNEPAFTAEMFLIVPGDFKTHFPRIMRLFDTAYDKYSKKMAETPSARKASDK